MDVRCEKCQTVYEFDDAKVTASGVTVKCTQCGNLFKVRRRATPTTGAQGSVPPRMPTPVGVPPVLPPERQRTTTMPRGAPSPPPRTPTPSRGVPVAPPPAPPGAPGDERVWMVRLASTGEVKRFRELTTLQQWIVEKRVTREDEISRSGETWKRLGGIAELASFFHVVEQADANAPTMAPDPALTTTAPMTPPPRYVPPVSFSVPVGNVGAVTRPERPINEPRAFAQTSPAATIRQPPVVGDVSETDLQLPRSGGRKVGIALVVVALVGALGGGGFLLAKKMKWLGGDEGRNAEAVRRARDLIDQDSDDQLRVAEQDLLLAHGADQQSALPVAGLAELNALWAGYLRDDARAAEAAKQLPRAEELRKMAQTHLDDARRYAGEAETLAPEDPDVNRAKAAFLLVDGAPASQVEGYLNRVESKRPDDPEASYLRGALFLRDGKLPDAKARLEQANALELASARHDLLRAEMLLAQIATQQGRKEDARALAQKVLDKNPRHDRARALLAELAAPPPAAVDAGAPPQVAQTEPVKDDKGSKDKPVKDDKAVKDKPAKDDKEEEEPRGGVDSLIAQGNRLLERGGHTKEAQKAFEKAIAQAPGNVEALNGLGYCFLDTEHFNNAIDTFKKTLQVSPSNGEAIMGLAEAYKMRGDKARALDYYKKYVADLPNGSKVRMAQTNVDQLSQEMKKSQEPSAGEVHDAPPLPTPPPP